MPRSRRTRRPPLRTPHHRPGPGHRHRRSPALLAGPFRRRTARRRPLRARDRPRRRAPRPTSSSPASRCWCPGPARRCVARAGTVRVRVGGDASWSDWSEPPSSRPACSAPTTGPPASSARARSAPGRPPRSWSRRVRPAGRHRQGPAVRDRARHLRRPAQRRAGRRRASSRPGWTAYQYRLRYQTYDVTDLVTAGANRLEFLLGNGWYRGRLGFQDQRALYGDRLALLAQLEVTTADGASHVLGHRRLAGPPGRARSSPTTCTTASPPTCGARRGRRDPVDVLDADLACWSRPTVRRFGSPRSCPRSR